METHSQWEARIAKLIAKEDPTLTHYGTGPTFIPLSNSPISSRIGEEEDEEESEEKGDEKGNEEGDEQFQDSGI